jgi:hypothetical protein
MHGMRPEWEGGALHHGQDLEPILVETEFDPIICDVVESVTTESE